MGQLFQKIDQLKMGGLNFNFRPCSTSLLYFQQTNCQSDFVIVFGGAIKEAKQLSGTINIRGGKFEDGFQEEKAKTSSQRFTQQVLRMWH